MGFLDLNCDMGESFGPWAMGSDDALLDIVTSANIACGLHAGDWGTMDRVVRAAVSRGVAVGAHPGLPDREGFGRRVMVISPAEAYQLTLYQIGALAAFAQAAGSRLHHVKPHGALYNMAAKDAALSEAIALAVRDAGGGLILVGLSGSELPQAGARMGLKVAHEVFADRSYQADGTLTPRTSPGALLESMADAVAQVLGMVRAGTVTAVDGTVVPLRADTLCIHGDTPGAVAFAAGIRAALEAEGVQLRACP